MLLRGTDAVDPGELLGLTATLDGRPVALARPEPGVVAVTVPSGHHALAIRPR